MNRQALHVGTAGWSIPRAVAGRFTGEGSHLARYARVLDCAEINTSFYRSHRPEVYARWAAQTPPGFRFAVKLPRSITHEQRLRAARAPLERFIAEVAGLGDRLGVLLVQLPPSLAFETRPVGASSGCWRACSTAPSSARHAMRAGSKPRPTAGWRNGTSAGSRPIRRAGRRRPSRAAGWGRRATASGPCSTTAGTDRRAPTGRPTATTGCRPGRRNSRAGRQAPRAGASSTTPRPAPRRPMRCALQALEGVV